MSHQSSHPSCVQTEESKLFFQLESEGEQCEWYYVQQEGPMQWLIDHSTKVEERRRKRRNVAIMGGKYIYRLRGFPRTLLI